MKLVKGPDLAGLKLALHNEIDARAEEERLKYITPGAGQALVYLQKEIEALELQANPNASAPHLRSHSAKANRPLPDIAAEVLTMAGQWRHVSAEIEGTRLAAKEAVTAATTVIEARQAAHSAFPKEN